MFFLLVRLAITLWTSAVPAVPRSGDACLAIA